MPTTTNPDLPERLQGAAIRLNLALERDRLGMSIAMNHRTRMRAEFNPGRFTEDFCISTLALLNVALGANDAGPHLSYVDCEAKGEIDRFIVCTGIDCNKECPVEQPAAEKLSLVRPSVEPVAPVDIYDLPAPTL